MKINDDNLYYNGIVVGKVTVINSKSGEVKYELNAKGKKLIDKLQKLPVGVSYEIDNKEV
jgi:ABC-type transporter Mla subunit MlaD